MEESNGVSSENAKAVSEVAKTTNTAILAASDLGKFLSKIISGPLSQTSEILEDKLRYLKIERRIRFELQINKLMSEVGITEPTRNVPIKIAIPIIQNAVYEEDDSLQDMWARLLLNASNADRKIEVTRSFVSILQDFGTLEVQILDVIYSQETSELERGVIAKSLPDLLRVREHFSANLYDKPAPHVEIALANLARTGCVLPSIDGLSAVYPTLLGKTLYEVCSLLE